MITALEIIDMKTTIALIAAIVVACLLAADASAGVACGPRGCVAARPFYGRPYARPYARPYYGREYRYHDMGCAWVGGVHVCR